jgi:hypothetical protein
MTRFPSSPAAAALALAVLAALALGTSGCDARAAEPPRLAVVVMVDQLTPELLERYDAGFEDGLRRLLDGGRVFDDAVHDHAITFTGPGHATPVTGVVPARHGIVGNSWRERREDGGWVTVNADTDPDAAIVGGTGSGRSPRNLLRDALPDWIQARHPESRVVSLSGKAPVAILMAGRTRGHAYWFDTGAGGFVTSDHYRGELPDWVARFNAEAPERITADGCWRAAASPELASLARRDTVAYEADGVHTFFPHCESSDAHRDLPQLISRTPFLDALTLELGRAAVRELALGRGEAPDYLALGLSATDRVGHRFGPWSREQLENLLALDRELGDFLRFLDEEVGEGRYVVALSSDHGVLPMPEHLQEEGRFGMRVNQELSGVLADAADAVRTGLAEAHATDGGEAEGEGAGDGSPTALSDQLGIEGRALLARELERVEWIEQALTVDALAADAPADSFTALYRNSFHPERFSSRMASHGLELRFREGALNRGTGTTHGVPYLHDRHVPLVFYGPGIPAGRSGTAVRTVDLAPTIAALLGVPVPDDLDGRALELGGR